MAKVYVYDPNETDCRTIGLCGALIPTSCTFHEIANGESTLELEHPYDDLNRFSFLQEDCILKTAVPVRNAPEVDNGRYVSSVASYKVISGSTKDDRTIYSKKSEGKKLKTVPVGARVTVLKMPEDGDRWKVSYKGKRKTYTGWMSNKDTVLDKTASNVTKITVNPNARGLESVTPSWTVKEQLFRIYSVEKSNDSVKVTARHISYDFMYNLVRLSVSNPDDYNTLLRNTELSTAIKKMLSSCIEKPDFSIETVITGSRAGNKWEGKDPITCILDPDVGICARWGGQLIRDNNELYILYNCGLDKGIVLEYGKNVSGVTYTLDTSNVATGIMPIGKDKNGKPVHILTDYRQKTKGKDEWLEGNGGYGYQRTGVVYTYGHGSFPFQRINLLEGSDCTEGDKGDPSLTTIRARLLQQAKQAVLNGCDEPEVSVKVDLQVIGDTMQYEKYKNLQSLFLYDYATVKYVRNKITIVNIKVTVSEIDWDVLNDRMKELTLGSLKDLTSKVSSWQVASTGSSNAYGADVYSTSQNSVLAALNDTNSDIFKRVVEIAKSN